MLVKALVQLLIIVAGARIWALLVARAESCGCCDRSSIVDHDVTLFSWHNLHSLFVLVQFDVHRSISLLFESVDCIGRDTLRRLLLLLELRVWSLLLLSFAPTVLCAAHNCLIARAWVR